MEAKAGAVWRFVAKSWPRVVAALQEVDTFLKDHPGIPTWLRDQAEGLRKRIITVQQRRGEAARIRGMLDIIRNEARELAAHDDRSATDAATWIRRADAVERGVRLAEIQARAEQKRTLARLRAEADVLVADLIDATTSVRSLPATGSPEEEPPAPA